MIDGIKDLAFIAGIVMGSIVLMSVSWVWVTKQVLGAGGIVMSFVGIALVGLTVWSSIRIEATPEGILAEFERELDQLNTMVNEVDTRVAEVDSSLDQVVSANLSFNEDLGKLTNSVENNNRQFILLTEELKSTAAVPSTRLDSLQQQIVSPDIRSENLQMRRQSLESLRRN